ncbi:unnamed protein product [Cutaneotrichosporon oleaginosum]
MLPPDFSEDSYPAGASPPPPYPPDTATPGPEPHADRPPAHIPSAIPYYISVHFPVPNWPYPDGTVVARGLLPVFVTNAPPTHEGHSHDAAHGIGGQPNICQAHLESLCMPLARAALAHAPTPPLDPFAERHHLMVIAGGIIMKMREQMSKPDIIQAILVVENLMARALQLIDDESVEWHSTLNLALSSALQGLHHQLAHPQ